MIARLLQPLNFHSLAQVPTSGLLNTAVEGLAIAAMVWMMLRLVGRLNSGTRFAVWFSALLAIAVLPFFSAGRGAAPAVAPITISSSWAIYLFAAWAAISTALFARLALGIWQVGKLRRSATPVDPSTLPAGMQYIFTADGTRRSAQLCVSGKVEVPAAFGFLKPAIIVPAWALTELSPEDLHVVLLHEMAHLRRWDDWTNLLQKAVKALFFFHPAVWWIESRLALEREMACDDMVLAQTASPKAYAASLISFAEKIQCARELALAHSVVGRMRQISCRVTRILDAGRPSATRVWKPVFGAVTVLSAAAFVAAPYAPRLVAFQKPQPAAVSAALESGRSVAPESERGRNSNVVPARLTTRVSHAPLPAVVHAAVHSRKLPPPGLVRAALKVQPAAAPVLLFMQSTRYQDESGSAILTLCIWQVSSANGAQRRVETLVMHSI